MASASSRNVDFSNVKDGGNFNRRRIPSGDYLAKITKIEDAEAKDGVFQYLVSIKIQQHPSSVFPYYCKLQENQLWKLRNLLIAAGLTVPKRRVKVDPNRLNNKLIGVTVEDDEYEGKEQSTIAGVFPAAELGDIDAPVEEEEEDEGDAAEDEDMDLDDTATTASDDEEEEEPEEEADPLESMSRAELKAALKKQNPKFQAKKSQSDDDLRTLLRNVSADEAEEEDEEEEPPAPKKAPAKKKAAAKKKKSIDEVSDDELEELDIDDL